MINLMYLVLTAMLALNVSAKIINAFFSIHNGIQASSKITERSNQLLAGTIEKSAESANKYAPFVEASKKVSDRVKQFVQYVEELRERIARGDKPEGTPREEYYYPETDDHHPGQPKNYKNKDVTTNLLVNEKKGAELKEEVLKCREELKKIVDDLAAKKIEGTNFGDADIKALVEGLPLNIDDESWQHASHGAPSPSWEHFVFNQMPVASIWPMFSKFQSDARSSEAMVLNFLASQIGATSFKVDAFVPISSPEKSYLLEGETFRSEIAVGASSQSFFENVSISVNSHPLIVKDGKALFEEKASGLGGHKYNVSISVKNPATGQNLSAQKDFEYEVGQSSVAMELTDMNVVYIGVENHLAVAAAGFSSNQVSVSVNGGGMTIRKDGASSYIIEAKGPATKEAEIVVTAGGKKFTKKVRVKPIPDPVAELGGKMEGVMGPAAMKAQTTLSAVLKNFDFAAKCSISNFEMYYIPKGGDVLTATNSGAGFKGQVADYINKAKFGDMYIFTNVKALCPGDAVSRPLNSLQFTIK